MRMPTASVAAALHKCRSAFLSIFLVSAAINVLMLTGPLFMLQVYDRVLASGSVPTLAVLGGIAMGLYLFNGLLDILRSRALTRISMHVYTQLCAPAFRANVFLPIYAGQKGERVQPGQDLDAIRRFLGSPGPAAIFDLPFMPFYFLIIFLFHPALGLLAVAGGVVIFGLVVANEISSRTPSRELTGRAGSQARLMGTARRNAEVLAALGMFQSFSERYAKRVEGHYLAQQLLSDRSTFFSSLIKMLRLLLQSAMLGFGAYLVIQHEVSAGVMIASSIIMSRALSPIEQAVAQWPAFVAARQASRRLSETLRRCPPETGSENLPLPKDDLRVEQLATSAPGEPVILLQSVQFVLGAGDAVGVIGPSGSGKTSLARAITGIWPVLRGSVRLDGSTLDQWVDRDRGRFLGYLPQDVELFDGTVAENISRFESEPSMLDIVTAAKLAGVHRLIANLPDGYNCMVGESGARLSAGQRQRIGLARALYGNPFLVVLDEPNSNLDMEGERALAAAIEAVRGRGGIVMVIAHRTSALSAVNKVLVIQNGRQLDFGDRDEVLSRLSVLPMAGDQQRAQVNV